MDIRLWTVISVNSCIMCKYCDILTEINVGTVIDPASEFYTGRLTKKERKATIADELLANGTFQRYRKRKVKEIEEKTGPAGVDKWKRNKFKKTGKKNRN